MALSLCVHCINRRWHVDSTPSPARDFAQLREAPMEINLTRRLFLRLSATTALVGGPFATLSAAWAQEPIEEITWALPVGQRHDVRAARLEHLCRRHHVAGAGRPARLRRRPVADAGRGRIRGAGRSDDLQIHAAQGRHLRRRQPAHRRRHRRHLPVPHEPGFRLAARGLLLLRRLRRGDGAEARSPSS